MSGATKDVAWIHNQDPVEIGSDGLLSHESFPTTGRHALRSDMALEMRRVVIGDGARVIARCMALTTSRIGSSALVLPDTAVPGEVPPGTLFGTPFDYVVGQRFVHPPKASSRSSPTPAASDVQVSVLFHKRVNQRRLPRPVSVSQQRVDPVR